MNCGSFSAWRGIDSYWRLDRSCEIRIKSRRASATRDGLHGLGDAQTYILAPRRRHDLHAQADTEMAANKYTNKMIAASRELECNQLNGTGQKETCIFLIAPERSVVQVKKTKTTATLIFD